MRTLAVQLLHGFANVVSQLCRNRIQPAEVDKRSITRGSPTGGILPTGPGRRQMRYDADIVDRFRSTGDGWQTRMNEALRTFLQEHPLDAQ
ncbi:BrnA antitoxin family protein [Paraburkholderia humisilvae]|uniref:BrnA antitoxin family protein n=1 Tax=Paraburkholderia humisilvae TaxID=627669 RepID=UPI0015825749